MRPPIVRRVRWVRCMEVPRGEAKSNPCAGCRRPLRTSPTLTEIDPDRVVAGLRDRQIEHTVLIQIRDGGIEGVRPRFYIDLGERRQARTAVKDADARAGMMGHQTV